MKYLDKQNCVVHGNLVKVKCLPQVESSFGIKCFTANARCLSSKHEIVRDYILQNKNEFGIVTETWFEDGKEENWQYSDLNQNDLHVITRRKKHGCLIALIIGDYVSVTKIKASSSGLWNLEVSV